LLAHAFGIVAVVDRISKPGDGELELSLTGFDVLGVFGIPGFNPITCTG